MSNEMYGATRLGQYKTNSRAPTDRADLGRLLGADDDDDPTLWEAVNYPTSSALDDFDTHWLRYERQGVAAGLIDKVVGDTWQDHPDITDESSADTEQTTEFDDALERFVSGESLRKKPHHRVTVGDKLATLGEYSLIVLGFADGRDLSQPVPVVDPDDEDASESERAFDGLADLNYIATFGQDRVVDMERVTDMMSERYRLPESYEVVTEEADSDDGEDDTQDIHWSRVIHVAEGTLEDDLRGTPYLKNIFHNLINLDKILAGSAEGYWRGGYAGLVLSPPTGPDGKQLRFDDEDGGSSELREEIRQYENNFKRTIATTGDIETLSPNVGDPGPHAVEQYKEIAAAKRVPQSMLMGNETGERATSEDSAMWKEHIAGRRNNFAEPEVVRPLIDRLINTGILPTPVGDGYEINWPPLDELSEQEEAEVAKTLADALKKLTGGQPDRLANRGELRELVGWDPTIGSESDIDEAEQPTDEAAAPTVDESDPEVQAAFDEQQSSNEDAPTDAETEGPSQ